MNPNKCEYWFIHSLLVENIDIGWVKDYCDGNESELVRLPESRSFSPYISVFDDEIICHDREQIKDEGRSVKLTEKESGREYACTLETRYHIEASGLCSHFSKLSIPDSRGLTTSDLIRISNLFEDEWLIIEIGNKKVKPSKPSEYVKKNLERLTAILRSSAGQGSQSESYDSLPLDQQPYVVTILYFNDSGAYDSEILKPLEELKMSQHSRVEMFKNKSSSSQANKAKALAALLYRFKTPDSWKDVDQSYIRAFSSRRGSGIENYHPHQGIFVTLHLRSMLVAADISEEHGNSKKLTKEFFPSLAGTIADSRARWFGLVVLNSQLDGYLRTLNDRLTPINLVRKLLAYRRITATLLDSTVAHRHASGSLSEIHGEFATLFGIRELTSDILAKINILEKTYYNIQQLRVLEDSRDSK